MANEEQPRTISTIGPHAKTAIIWLAALSLAITALPAMGIVAVFMALFAPIVVPFMLVEGVSEAKHGHA